MVQQLSQLKLELELEQAPGWGGEPTTEDRKLAAALVGRGTHRQQRQPAPLGIS